MLALIFTLFLNGFLFAQNLEETGKFNSDPLVSSLNVPFGFKNFVQDSATQILLLPAKGAGYSKSFFFGTYSPTISKQNQDGNKLKFSDYPSFSFSSLQGKGDTKWLWRLDNETNYFTFDNFDKNDKKHDLRSYPNSYDSTFAITTTDKNSKNKEVLTRFKILKIKKTKTGGSSYGIFATANFKKNKNRTETEFNKVIFDQSYDERKYFSEYQNLDKNKTDSENSRFALGFEFSKSKKHSDFKTELSYSYTKRNFFQSIGYHFLDNDTTWYFGNTTDTTISINKTDNTFEKFSKSNPHTLNLKTYFQKKTDWLQNGDNLFFDLNASYILNSKFTSKTDVAFLTTRNYDSEISTTDSLAEIENSEGNENFLGVNFKTGYVLPKQKDDIFFLTGLSTEMEISSYDGLRSEQETVYFGETEKTDLYQTKLIIPFYTNYTPTNWFSVFGGLNYHFTYKHKKTTSKGSTDIGDTFYPGNFNLHKRKTVETENTFGTSTNFYLGMTLRHKSGLVSHVAFNGNFGDFNNWNISLGYLF
ncbi:hypothetical protein IT568_08000 [bacterium]|nr:hypothetical protein [bacterium]